MHNTLLTAPGIQRSPYGESIAQEMADNENCFTGKVGDCLTYTFDKAVHISKIRIVLKGKYFSFDVE